jgi:outer membrane lipoprotein-sorting protein
MNRADMDDALRRAHDVFRRNHDAGRQQLLERLSDSPLPMAAHRLPVPRLVKGVLVAAATLLVGVTLGLGLWLSPNRAYAMGDLPARLQEIRSLHLTGWIYAPDETKHPFTFFAERPNRYWLLTYGFSGGGDGQATRVVSGFMAGKGRERMVGFDTDKKAFVSEVPAVVSELQTETLLQTWIMQQYFQGSLEGFAKIASEAIRGTPCDVYERTRDAQKTRVWLDPKTGLPVKIALSTVDRSGQERPEVMIDQVATNVTAEAAGISFAGPKGFEVVRTPRAQAMNPLLEPVFAGSMDETTLAQWYCFNIDDRAALLCWSHRSPPNGKDAAPSIELVLDGVGPCNDLEVATVDVEGQTWQWSLVVPKKTGQPLGSGGIELIARARKGGQLSLSAQPLRFPEDRLKEVLKEVQRLTLPAEIAVGEPLSLDKLRARLGGVR